MASLISQISQGIANMFVSPHSAPAGEEAQYDDISSGDVLEVRSILSSNMNLPMELVDDIMDYAEFWRHMTVQTHGKSTVQQSHFRNNGGNILMLRTPPIGFYQDSEDQSLWEDTWSKQHAEPARPGETFKDMSTCSPEIKAKLPALVHPVRKIVFTITSHDQGWASDRADPNNEYGHSWTWFDVGLERFSTTPCANCAAGQCSHSEWYKWEPDMSFCTARTVLPETGEPDRNGTVDLAHTNSPGQDTLQTNKRADMKNRTHTVVWSWDDDFKPDSIQAEEKLVQRGRGRATGTGEFVRSLKTGDMITVWAKARFPGWVNYVESIKVEVYWVE